MQLNSFCARNSLNAKFQIVTINLFYDFRGLMKTSVFNHPIRNLSYTLPNKRHNKKVGT